MKKYSFIVFLVVLCAFSWFFTIKSIKTGNAAFESFMAAADAAYGKKVFSDAEENYKKAVSKRPKDEKALLGLANTYYAEEKYKEAADTCEKILAEKPGDVDITILEAKCLVSGGKYSKSVQILGKVEQTEKVTEMIKDIKSRYTLKYFSMEKPQNFDVYAPLGRQLCTVFEKNHASAYNSRGIRVAHGDITALGGVCEDGELYPAVSEDKWCFVDSGGKRKLVPDEEYDLLRPINQGFAVARSGRKYVFIDASMQEKSGPYELACNFCDGKAVVKKDGKIKIIDTAFETIAETGFTGVVEDEYGYADHFGTSVFIKKNTYFLCNSSGAKINDFSAEYIGLPAESGALVQFKSKNLYGFVSSETGKIAIKPQYEDAKPFCRGLAPIKTDGKWGFIDEKGNEIVPPTFTFVTPLSEDGSAWIKNEAGFALLTFYYLSEEE